MDDPNEPKRSISVKYSSDGTKPRSLIFTIVLVPLVPISPILVNNKLVVLRYSVPSACVTITVIWLSL